MPISVSYKHVEGHQSTKYPGLELDKWGVLNKEMDALAKAYLSYSEHLPSLSQEVDCHEWSVSISDEKICTKLKKQLSLHLRSLPIVSLWINPTKQHHVQHPPKFTSQQIQSMDIHNTQAIWSKARGCITNASCVRCLSISSLQAST